ncbi:hypothetical protein FN846DRAFT_887635 [Sphaerosporella brunnea]|uniref:Uncharacterized protein n=1 Tax=Sphaerosporella brunnea TaxID=1250544 RepID=A0A5J5F5J2_9PEZI|nr:hypothetical protein FN846DRAFT_887635 [Sphaerosporella brunnea]
MSAECLISSPAPFKIRAASEPCRIPSFSITKPPGYPAQSPGLPIARGVVTPALASRKISGGTRSVAGLQPQLTLPTIPSEDERDTAAIYPASVQKQDSTHQKKDNSHHLPTSQTESTSTPTHYVRRQRPDLSPVSVPLRVHEWGSSRDTTPFPHSSGSESGAATPISTATQTAEFSLAESDAESDLLTPNPFNSTDVTHDWKSVPNGQSLWRSPSRLGVRSSDRLRNTSLPKHQEGRRWEQKTNDSGALPWWLLLAVMPLLLIWQGRITDLLPASSLTLQAHCLLSPLCPAWSESRTQTTYELLTRTTQQVAATHMFKNSTLDRLAKLQTSVQILRFSLQAEAKVQTSLARTLAESTSADTLGSVSRDLIALYRDLVSTQAMIHGQIMAATKLLRRIGGFLLQQSGRREIIRPHGWDRQVPTIQSFALETTLRKNYAGFLTGMREICRNVDYELFEAQRKVRAVLKHLHEVVEDGNLGDLHSGVIVQLKLLLKELNGLREGEVMIWAERLVDPPETSAEAEGSRDLVKAFVIFYVELDDLEDGAIMGLRKEAGAAETRALGAPMKGLDIDQMRPLRTAVELL